MISNAVKSFDILATNSSVLHNYFNSPSKLLSYLNLTKLLNTSAKLVFFYSEAFVFLNYMNHFSIIMRYIVI